MLALEQFSLVSPAHPAIALEKPLDRFEVHVPAAFDHLCRCPRLGQAGFRQHPHVGDGALTDALSLLVPQALGEVHEVAGGRTVDVEPGCDHLYGVAVPEPGDSTPPQHVPEPSELVTTRPAGLRFGPDQSGFGLGVLDVPVHVTRTLSHVGGPVVDPLPLLLVRRHDQRVEPRPFTVKVVSDPGLDRFLFRVVK